jgi:ethanolamine utilization microcompartment shell protein EutL
VCTRDSRSTRATAHEDAVKAKQAEIEAKLPILSGLTDRAGDDLVRAVGAALDDGWREEIVAGEAEAAARVDAAIAELDVALQAHTKAKSASAWAQKFETAAALTPGWHRVPDMRYRPG